MRALIKGESYLLGQSRQIKNYLLGLSRQITHYLLGLSCQMKKYFAGLLISTGFVSSFGFCTVCAIFSYLVLSCFITCYLVLISCYFVSSLAIPTVLCLIPLSNSLLLSLCYFVLSYDIFHFFVLFHAISSCLMVFLFILWYV